MPCTSRLIAPLLAASLVVMPSCAFLAGAAVGAGALYALGEDSTERYLDATLDEVYAAAQAVLAERGEVGLEDPGAREAFLRARVGEDEVEVFLTAVTDTTTRMVVQARRWAHLAPDLEAAETLADRIADRVGG